VNEDFVTVSEPIPYVTVMQPDANMEIDQRATAVVGLPGVLKRTTRIVYENGREVSRNLDREWVDEKPVNQVIAYGTKIIIHTMDTPDGPIQYWRQSRFWVTYYTPLHAGTPYDVPWFGMTATGIKAERGIIAVDPRAIPMHTNMYVPGYGFGRAEDTGGLIKGKIIDLCYNDDDPTAYQRGWWPVYFLVPVPDNVPYLLPDYPTWGDVAPSG
jgi:3D (Asp-Asp-Asp) domain-containing protein